MSVGPRYLECLSLLAVSKSRDLKRAETSFSASGQPHSMGISYSCAGAVIIQLETALRGVFPDGLLR